MPLSAGWTALALKLQEASVGLTHGNVRDRLSDAVNDIHKDGAGYGHYIDHDGDGESGNCVYYSGGETCSAPYTLGTVNGKMHASIDHENRVPVTPQITYHAKADDDDHYTAMEEAGLYQPGSARLVERFISKGERDKADAGDFAGKGKSFPILKPGDVSAAVHAMGRAGSKNYGMSGLKSRIMAIAKKKGWTSSLPKTWQDGGDDKECMDSARVSRQTGEAVLVESAGIAEILRIKESTGQLNPLVKIISEGRGSSGYYPASVLKRDGPEIFKRGTLMYINHATDAEEAARPEGDWSKLAAVTTGDAYWDETGPDGAALYAPAKVFSNVAAEVREKAPHTGVSIRAAGQYAEASTGQPKPGLKAAESKLAPDGKPGLIGKLTRADSIDLVTKAGRDGKLLLESANSNEGGADDMDATELRRLQESNRKLAQRLARTEAREIAEAKLRPITLPMESKIAIVERAVPNAPVTADGEFDAEAFDTLLEAEIKYAASLIPGGVQIVGMGTADPKVTEAQHEAAGKEWAAARDTTMDELARFVMGEATDGADKGERKKFKRLHQAFREGRAAA
jgi:hypothetical protein